MMQDMTKTTLPNMFPKVVAQYVGIDWGKEEGSDQSNYYSLTVYKLIKPLPYFVVGTRFLLADSTKYPGLIFIPEDTFKATMEAMRAVNEKPVYLNLVNRIESQGLTHTVLMYWMVFNYKEFFEEIGEERFYWLVE